MYQAIARHTSAPVAASSFTSGSHLPLTIAVIVIVAAVLLKVVVAKRRGVPALGAQITVRCGQGHLFRTTWSAMGSFTAIRLGSARFQHCPVGGHWSLVRPVNDADLTPQDRRMAERNRDSLLP